MTDELYLGPVPCDESCEQLGHGYDADKARKECSAYKNQLRRMFPNPPENAGFRTKSNPHDFGTYFEVIVFYDDTDETSMEYAFNVERNLPESWDEEARKELKI